jgi:hypothetical protein
MALIDILRNGVQAIASKALDSFKGNVTLTPWIGTDGRGANAYGSPVTLRALIDPTKRTRYTGSGVLVMTFATLTFLDPIADTAPNTGETRQQPIDPRDKIVLPDGGTAPIVQTGGFMDPLTSRPIVNETILGSVVRGQ